MIIGAAPHTGQRCKGRFCTTCYCAEMEEWSRVLLEDVIQEDIFQVSPRIVKLLHTEYPQ